MSIADGLAQVHAWGAVVAAAAAGVLVVLGVLDALGVVPRAAARRWLDRVILALLVAVVLAAVLGPLVLALAGPPRDWLHLLYAALALAAAPVARFVAAQRRSALMGAWVAAGGLVTLGVLLRLWGTGG